MLVCARAGVHREAAQAAALFVPLITLPFALLLLFLDYTQCLNPPLIIRKFKFLLHFSCASYFLHPSSSNVAFSCCIGSGLN